MIKRIHSQYPPEFWRMCGGALLFFLSFNLMLPELPAHLRSIGGSKYLGWIVSSFSICALLARPLSGWVTDKLGRKWVMLGGTAFCVAAGLLYPLTYWVWFFFMVRGLHGFSAGLAPTGFTAYTADIVPKEKRGEAMGWQGMFSNLGASAGFALGSAIVVWIGINGMYIASSLMALTAMLLFTGLPETRIKSKSKAESWAGLFFFKAWKPALIMLFVCIPPGAILTIMPDYTTMLGFKNKGLYLAVYIAFSLLIRISSGRLSDRLGRPICTAIGTTFQVLAMFLLLYFQNQFVFFLSAALYGIGQGFNAPSLFAWATDKSDEHTRGRAMGMLFIALETGFIIGSLFAGAVFKLELLNFKTVFALMLASSFAALALSLLFIKKGA